MQVKSKQRVTDHGEVFTSEREVNAMLNLVGSQVENPEKTFLEPACGNGNFLTEILRRKLEAVSRKHKKNQYEYEHQSLIALGSIYGIDLLIDNINDCRDRLFEIFKQIYVKQYPNTFQQSCLRSARYILSCNILQGNALTLKSVDGENNIIFAEWKAVNGSFIQRRDYIFSDLVNKYSERDMPLFSDLGVESFIPNPSRNDYRPTHFLELGND